MRLLHLPAGSLTHSSWENRSSCLRFEVFPHRTACFSSFHRGSTGLRSGLFRSRSFQNSPVVSSQLHFGAFSCVFRVIMMLQNPELSDTGQYILPQNDFIVPWPDPGHPVPGTAKNPKNITVPHSCVTGKLFYCFILNILYFNMCAF